MIKKKLIVKRVINNNIVIAEDFNGHEVVAIGKGLGFRKVTHDVIAPYEVSKTYFLLHDEYLHNANYISQTLEQIPYEIIELTERIIDVAQADLQHTFHVNLVVSLADHINFSVNQFHAGFDMPVLISEEVKRFYKEEYAVGKKAIHMINDTLHVKLKKEEAASIAFHLIAATEKGNHHDSMRIMKGVGKIISIVEDDLQITLDEESVVYSRFVIHLKFFMKSILFEQVQTVNDAMMEILSPLERNNGKANHCVERISEYVLETYEYRMTNDDRLYLLIHIIRVLDQESLK